jgi:hypothetical protein
MAERISRYHNCELQQISVGEVYGLSIPMNEICLISSSQDQVKLKYSEIKVFESKKNATGSEFV